MKKLVYILFFSLIIACDSESAGDCLQKAGAIIQKVVTVSSFDKILVNRDIELIIKEGTTQSVVIETGKNLINDVELNVIDGRLILTNNNFCNYIRDYGITKIYVTSPNITEVRSSTQYDISSDGVLCYPSLNVLSEDFGAPESFNVGDFKLEVNNTRLSVVFNNLSVAYISGETDNLSITFAAGTSRFEGRNLMAQNVSVFNRGSNDMIVNPQQKITGKISGIGDVISVNAPPIIDVEEVYRGRLIFE